MPSPDHIFSHWQGIRDYDFFKTLYGVFDLPASDSYIYKAETFAMTLPQIQEQINSGELKYRYQAHGQQVEVSPSDIMAYTSIFSPSTDTSKALKSFSSNAKKSSPRETVAKYLESKRIAPMKIPKSKAHVNPYYDFWVLACQLTSFLGPLPDASYADPASAKLTHPILPIFYHHFGCAVPTHEALYIIAQLGPILDLGSGNGYWTYMLRLMGVDVVAVDSMDSEYRVTWIEDTVKADGVNFLRKSDGNRALLMVYPVTQGRFTERALQEYKGDSIVIVGTMNANRYTGFPNCTAEEWIDQHGGWDLEWRLPLPSFAGKDDGICIWKRKEKSPVLSQNSKLRKG